MDIRGRGRHGGGDGGGENNRAYIAGQGCTVVRNNYLYIYIYTGMVVYRYVGFDRYVYPRPTPARRLGSGRGKRWRV